MKKKKKKKHFIKPPTDAQKEELALGNRLPALHRLYEELQAQASPLTTPK